MPEIKIKPLVSIVIPVYNHAEYIGEAINSVLAQDYHEIELIVINDGSTDNTKDVLDKYSDKVTIIYQDNIGQAATLNKGWSIASGDILAYLSSDDTILPAAVSRAVDTLLNDDTLSVVYPDFYLLDPYSRIVRKVTTPEFEYAKMLTHVSCPIGPGAFFRKEAFVKSGDWDCSLRQMPDYDFWLRMGLHGRIARIPEVLAGFRVHEGSQTYSVTNEACANEPVIIIQKLFDENAENSILKRLQKKALSSAYMVSSQLHIRSGRIMKGMRYFMKSVSLSPINGFSFRSLRILFNALFNRIGHRLLWLLRGKPVA